MRILFTLALLCSFAHCQSGVSVGPPQPTPDHLLILPNNPSTGLSGSQVFTASIVMSDGSNGGPVNCDGMWTSSSTGIAAISNAAPSFGLASAVGTGSTTISCTLANTVCANNTACTGSTTLTIQSPNIVTPSAGNCVQPCALANGLGPPSPIAYGTNPAFIFQGSGGTPPYTWSVSAGSLPAWASLNSSTGAITGTPNAVATTLFTIQLCDNISSCVTLPVSLTVVANSTSFFPNSTTSQLAINKFAGQNSSVPAALQGAAQTTFSITSNVFTGNVTNTFTTGEIVGISGCTTATYMNGTILTTNGSTTATKIVGAWTDTHGTALTHANVGATGDTTCYYQGQGWNPFVTAPFPAPGSTNCTQGNPCTGQSGALTSADINTWSLDWGTPSGALNSAPKNVITMLVNSATFSSGCSPSKSGETNDPLISRDDTAGGYFFACVTGGAIFYAHGHMGTCGGNPCFLMDTPVSSGWYNANSMSAVSRTTRPGVNQAKIYKVDISNNYQPTLQSITLTYNATGCAGQPCVTGSAPTTVFNLSSCGPGFQYMTVGTGLLSAQPLMIGTSNGTSDTDFEFALGNGSQNGTDRHSIFHIYNSGANCEIWDTEGFSGSGLHTLGTSSGGTGNKVGDTLHFAGGGGVCAGTVSVNTVNGSGSVTALGTATMSNNSGCVLGATMTASGGSGSVQPVLIVTGVGTAAATCCNTIWLSGASTPTATTVDTFGIHGGAISGNGAYIGTSGWGTTPQSPCGVCVSVRWQTGTGNLLTQTSNLLGGHPANGMTHQGVTAAPNYVVSLWSDPTCTPISNCPTLYSGFPSNSMVHSRWPTPSYDDTWPIIMTSTVNVPGGSGQQPSNPPNWQSPFALSLFAVEQNGTTHWFMHTSQNTNNTTENFQATNAIVACSQDGKFCLIPMDCFSGWAGNLGCGVNGGVPYPPMFAITLN